MPKNYYTCHSCDHGWATIVNSEECPECCSENIKVIELKPITESDPNGVKPNEPGAKLDAGKNMVASILGGFPRALEAVSEVGTIGANKYSLDGWQSVPDGFKRYSDAMMRHWIKERKGELYDDEEGGIGTLHAAQVAWNALARLELLIRELESKDETN